MRIILAVLAVLLATPALAQSAAHKPEAKGSPAPKELGKFEDWIAATHQETGTTICYAFVAAKNSAPALPGRSQVILTVTERATGRDAVAVTAGYAFPKGAAPTMQVGTTGLDFYTSGSDAFARDGKAVVAAFQKGEVALMRSPGPREGQVIADTFSLRGFSAAYAAISKACPAK
jgi:invasion protein IalB